MTKYIHIINGDSSNYKVKVKVQDRAKNGEWEYTDDWVDAEIVSLNNPGQLTSKYLTSTRRLVIEEDGTST